MTSHDRHLLNSYLEIARAKTNVVGQPYAFHHSYLPIDFSASTPKPPAGRMAIN